MGWLAFLVAGLALITSVMSEGSLCTTGMMQSPINLSPLQCMTGQLQEPVQTFGYDKVRFNKSFSSDFLSKLEINMGIHGGGLEGFYRLYGVHFHFPAEHKLNGQSMAGEIHFVHYLEKLKSFPAALNVKDGVAVVGVLVKMDNMFGQNSVAEAMIGLRPLKDLLPIDSDYFKYKGSLTTDNCNENIIWFVYSTPVYVSPMGVDILRTIAKPNRPVQPLNNRTVYLYNGFGTNEITPDKSKASSTEFIKLTTLLMIFIFVKNLL